MRSDLVLRVLLHFALMAPFPVSQALCGAAGTTPPACLSEPRESAVRSAIEGFQDLIMVESPSGSGLWVIAEKEGGHRLLEIRPDA